MSETMDREEREERGETMSEPTYRVKRTGKGEGSVIRVVAPLCAFSMTQSEARQLIDALSRVTLMPPRGPSDAL